MKQCCIENCENPCEPKRRYCRRHYLERHRAQAKARYLKYGKYCYKCTCVVCGKRFDGDRKTSKFCSWDCYSKFRYTELKSTNAYEHAQRKTYDQVHRDMAERLLGKLNYNVVVHHIDGDHNHNVKDNLLVLNRRSHVKLHMFLGMKRVDLIRSNEFRGDKWKSLIWPCTKAWLDSKKIPYIRLDQVGEDSQEILEKILSE